MGTEEASQGLEKYHRQRGHVVWSDITQTQADEMLALYKTGVSLQQVGERYKLPVSGLHRLFLRLYGESYLAEAKAHRPVPKWQTDEKAFRARVAEHLTGGYLVTAPATPVTRGLDTRALHLIATPLLLTTRSYPSDWPLGIHCVISGQITKAAETVLRLLCRSIGASPSVAMVDPDGFGVALHTLDTAIATKL